MAKNAPTDEDLMAFADGVLAPDAARAMAEAAALDPALAKKVEMFKSSRRLVREALAPVAEEPVPDALRRAIEAKIAAAGQAARPPDNVVQLRPRRAAPADFGTWAQRIAACLVLGVTGAAGFMAGRSGVETEQLAQVVVGGGLAPSIGAVLETAASGSESQVAGGRVRLIATVKSKDQTLCREFEIDSAGGDTAIGLACRREDGWRIQAAVSAPQTKDGYAPASSTAAIDAYLDAIEASEALAPDAEKAALDALR